MRFTSRHFGLVERFKRQHPSCMLAGALRVLPLVVRFLTPLSESEKSELLEACSNAFQGGTCIEVSIAEENAALQATVEASGDEHFLVEFWANEKNRQVVSSREITFRREDAPLDRARSIGLTLGILAGSAQQESAAPLSSESAIPTKRAENNSPPDDTSTAIPLLKKQQATSRALVHSPKKFTSRSNPPLTPSQHTWYLGAAAGASYDPSWGQVGPSADLHLRKRPFDSNSLLVIARLSLGYNVISLPRLQFIHLAPTAGLGWRFSMPHSELHLVIEGGVEFLSTTIQTEASPRTGPTRGSDTKGIARTEISYFYSLGRSWHWQLSPAFEFIFSPTDVRINDAIAESTGHFRIVARTGIAWSM